MNKTTYKNALKAERDKYIKNSDGYSSGDIDEAAKRLINAWPEFNNDYEGTKALLIEEILKELLDTRK